MSFTELTESQLGNKLAFIDNYMLSTNNAEGSKLDANANVGTKSVASLRAEIHKDIDIQIGRALVKKELTTLFNTEIAEQYIKDIDNHFIYCHDESSPYMPYCTSITLYPLLLDGLLKIGGDSIAPKHLTSFNGSLVNLVYLVSGQTSGAVAINEWLMYFDYFATKDYGPNYLETHTDAMKQELQQFVYALNQPLGRTNQSPFSNVSIYDKEYFEGVFGSFAFPDGTKPSYESVNKLQKFFMKWFNKERTKAVLTFPVVTAAMLHDNEKMVDTEFKDFVCQELSEGNAFFIFTDNNPSSLSTCCRLRLNVEDSLKEFSFSTGAGGIQTGSLRVIALNLPRFFHKFNNEWEILMDIYECTKNIVKYLSAHKSVLKGFLDADLMPIYNGGFISMDKQFVTVGINGVVELAELLGYTPDNNKDYKEFVHKLIKIIVDATEEVNKEDNLGLKLNVEVVPAENLGVKNAKWCKEVGIDTNRECHNSYMYPVEDESISITDKIELHGDGVSNVLTGGQALHLNLENYPTPEAVNKLLEVIIAEKCNYFCFNVKVTKCNSCTHINKHTVNECPQCGSEDVVHCTRVIGYLRPISHFSLARQREEAKRKYH